ncbi:hypothetical protein, partial [uncultured Hymenobacter sp.]|uniref:hypothetical protein n=1 Tax=uncultured Hymenobacter sp. TaxID=170016 RepID=UPI0035CC9D7C
LPVDFSTETVNIAVQYRSTEEFYHKGTITRDDTKESNTTGPGPYTYTPAASWVYNGVFDRGIFFFGGHYPITDAIEFRIIGENI